MAAIQQQLGMSFLAPTTITASEEATGHPATNVGVFTKFRRTARSTTTTDPWIVVCDFGATTTIAGIFLNNSNFQFALVATSPNGTTWTEVGTFSNLIDDRVQPRRKIWIPNSGWTASRYYRIRATTLLAGETYFELGTMAFPSPISGMTRNFAPPRWTPREPITWLDYAGGGNEINVEGPDLMSYDLQFGPSVPAAMTQQMQLRGVGQGLPFFYFENRGDMTKAYILKRRGEVTVQEQVGVLQVAPWTLIEAS